MKFEMLFFALISIGIWPMAARSWSVIQSADGPRTLKGQKIPHLSRFIFLSRAWNLGSERRLSKKGQTLSQAMKDSLSS